MTNETCPVESLRQSVTIWLKDNVHEGYAHLATDEDRAKLGLPPLTLEAANTLCLLILDDRASREE